MKAKALKPLLLSAAAILLVVSTVLATMAYMTSSSAVSNVFTVGNVKLNMTETKVNNDGTPVAGAARTDTNSYHLVPGKSYLKDPIIEIGGESDKSYLFVRVRNDLKSIECPGTINLNDGSTAPCPHTNCQTILEQMKANGWQEIERASTNVDAVFVYVGKNNVVENTSDADGNKYVNSLMPDAVLVGGNAAKESEFYTVFEKFALSNEVPNLESFGGARVAIVAYAIQADLTGAGVQCSPEAYKNAWQYIKNELPFVV